MYNREKVELKNKKQIEVYKELITELEKSKEVFIKFDKKIVNVKLVNELKNTLSDNTSVSLKKNEYTNIKYIKFWNSNRSIQGKNYHLDFYNTYYIDTNEVDIELNQDKRLDTDFVIIEIDSKIKSILNKIEKIENASKQIEEMKKEFESIQNQINNFKEKYHYSIREGKKFYC